jgi:hypothetical protein
MSVSAPAGSSTADGARPLSVSDRFALVAEMGGLLRAALAG